MKKGDARSFVNRSTGLSKILTELRLESGMTLDDLVEKTKLSKSILGDYERGHRSPKVSTLEIILEVFDYEIDVIKLN